MGFIKEFIIVIIFVFLFWMTYIWLLQFVPYQDNIEK